MNTRKIIISVAKKQSVKHSKTIFTNQSLLSPRKQPVLLFLVSPLLPLSLLLSSAILHISKCTTFNNHIFCWFTPIKWNEFVRKQCIVITFLCPCLYSPATYSQALAHTNTCILRLLTANTPAPWRETVAMAMNSPTDYLLCIYRTYNIAKPLQEEQFLFNYLQSHKKQHTHNFSQLLITKRESKLCISSALL